MKLAKKLDATWGTFFGFVCHGWSNWATAKLDGFVLNILKHLFVKLWGERRWEIWAALFTSRHGMTIYWFFICIRLPWWSIHDNPWEFGVTSQLGCLLRWPSLKQITPKQNRNYPCISLSQSLRTSWHLLKNAEPCTTSWFFQEMLHEWIGRMDTFWCWIPQTSKCLVTLQLDISQSRWRRWKLSIFNELSN
jgi:hypothetical protein